MNTSHYPSLELCRKLTEAGFPETQLWIFDTRKSWKKYNCPYVSEYEEPKFIPFWNIKIWESELEITDFKNNPSAGYNESLPLVCPSVMELLDEMPHYITTDQNEYELNIRMNWDSILVMYVAWMGMVSHFYWTLPNALAEMWIWLKENNYLTK
jgi:hypothetical protein